ncbi:hypothetical protein NIES2100_04590 [Calothrix sp. NIES-2100]|uniref:DUF4360 domain-containing protein n=1 Tax=Calothrix sp. NIES-2100 TaxID=1954172 RepID=UPI000B5EAE0F|nr:hypothetical protein NIES2100_04590 [Calothrix sp. NIES-2100]
MNGKKLVYSLGASLAIVAATLSLTQAASAETLGTSEPKQLGPPAKEVYIKDFTYAGSGCPANSVASLFSDDRQTLELLFDQFQANLQPTKMGEAAFPPQSNCSISLKLHVPAGWSASWHRVEHRGFADTSGNANGQLRARYYIPGAGGFDELRVYDFPSKMVRDYTIVNDAISTAQTQCSADVPMTVTTRIRLSGNPTGYNALTVDSISKKVKTILHFRWQRCNQ